MFDIVLPKDNEKELIRMAERLGWTKLCLAYDMPKDISEFKVLTSLKLILGIIVEPGKESKFKDKADLLICRISDPDKLRIMCEQGIINIISGIEMAEKPDFMHHRNSGVNHIICKLMADKDIEMCFDFSAVLQSSKKRRAVILGRMKQNILFARKYNISVIISTFASDPKNMRDIFAFKSFLSVYGVDYDLS